MGPPCATLGRPRVDPGSKVGRHWVERGSTMGRPCAALCRPWVDPGSNVCRLWVEHGSTMGRPCATLCRPWVDPGSNVGRPWVDRGSTQPHQLLNEMKADRIRYAKPLTIATSVRLTPHCTMVERSCGCGGNTEGSTFLVCKHCFSTKLRKNDWVDRGSTLGRPRVDRTWVDPGSNVGRPWIDRETTLGRPWVDPGLTVGRHWVERGSTLGRTWVDHGSTERDPGSTEGRPVESGSTLRRTWVDHGSTVRDPGSTVGRPWVERVSTLGRLSVDHARPWVSTGFSRGYLLDQLCNILQHSMVGI